MTPSELAAIRERHVRVDDTLGYHDPWCNDDEQSWPCDAASLSEYAAALEPVVEAAKAWRDAEGKWRVFWSDSEAALAAAVDALRGGE